MHARITRIPNYLVSLCLIVLLAAALVADQARANLHPEIRVSTAFHTSTEEQIDRDFSRSTGCRTRRSTVDADASTFSSTPSPVHGARPVANEPL
ncbi:MAG: hypothetical protein WDZ50_00625 [Woeseia sp.]